MSAGLKVKDSLGYSDKCCMAKHTWVPINIVIASGQLCSCLCKDDSQPYFKSIRMANGTLLATATRLRYACTRCRSNEDP